MNISYAILACNEHNELKTLFNKLLTHVNADDEIVVVLDKDNVTEEVKALCEDMDALPNFHMYYHSLNKDFAEHKNFLISKCTKDWIFNIDADEYPSEILMSNLNDILEINIDVDMIAIPRVNKVNGLTQDHIRKWGWQVDSNGNVNWPDFQLRLFKNVSYIKWINKVHEKPIGWKVGTHLPYETDEFALMHIKDIQRQEKQNELYDTIS
jgi:hypothetical protein